MQIMISLNRNGCKLDIVTIIMWWNTSLRDIFYISWFRAENVLKLLKMSKKNYTSSKKRIWKICYIEKLCINIQNSLYVMDFSLHPSKKSINLFWHQFLAEKARISEKMYRGSVWSFRKCWDFAFNYVFPLTLILVGQEKWYMTCLYPISKYYLFLFRCPLFVTKTLKCNLTY